MGGGCWIPGSALPACQLGSLPPLLNVSDDVSCPSQLFPLGTGQQGLFYTHSQQLGWLGTGLLPELCQVGSVAVLPSQLLSEPTPSSVLVGSGAHLAGLSFQSGSPRAGQESRVCLEAKNPPDHPLLGRAEQGPFCPALGTSPPTLSCPPAALTRGRECDRDFVEGGMSHTWAAGRESPGGMSGSHVLSVLQIFEFQAQLSPSAHVGITLVPAAPPG